MNILITGSAGFIGFNFSYFLLKNKKYKIMGIDNLNDYYDVSLKKKRLKILKKFKNFKFIKTDINNSTSIEQIFKKNKFDFVFNLAAQAGVRYSIHHPRKYIESNIVGYFNIIENCKKFKIRRLFYASSSSVYGENTNFPLKETEKIYPKNMYGLSKKINEEISKIYNNYYGLKLIGLRFFTVYGEWGRPDMMMLKYINSHFTKKEFKLFNYGNHSRDFTYIGDVVKILELLIKKNKKLPDNDILNICSNKPINLNEIIKFMKKNDINPKIKKIALQQADILKTHGDNSKLLKYINYEKFADWRESLKKTIEWYKKYSKK